MEHFAVWISLERKRGQYVLSVREAERQEQEVEAREDAILASARQGDQEAFAELVRLYERRVYNLAYRMTNNADDAWDISQEVFLRVHAALPKFRGDSSFSTWLYRIAANVCLDELRRRKRQEAVSLDEPLRVAEGELVRQTAGNEPDPERVLEQADLRQAVAKCIKRLPAEYRMAIILRDLQGFSYQEIALQLDCSLGTVKSRINRGRQALKEMFTALELFPHTRVLQGERRAGQ
jgi:RNA polymerase sigma-70 factor (ECF subfamily)